MRRHVPALLADPPGPHRGCAARSRSTSASTQPDTRPGDERGAELRYRARHSGGEDRPLAAHVPVANDAAGRDTEAPPDGPC